jgi:hypothetical protein
LSRNIAIAVVCGLFLFLSVFEAFLSASKGGRLAEIGATTERWFASDAFVEAARERKLASTRRAPGATAELEAASH